MRAGHRGEHAVAGPGEAPRRTEYGAGRGIAGPLTEGLFSGAHNGINCCGSQVDDLNGPLNARRVVVFEERFLADCDARHTKG